MIYCGIQARMSSSRLPGKVLMNLGGKSMLQRVYEACQSDEWTTVVLFSSNKADLPIEDHCQGKGLKYIKSYFPQEDVLGRYARVASSTHCECLVRVCADAPFMRAEWIERAIAISIEERAPVFMPGALHAGHWTYWMQAREWCNESDREHAGHDWFDVSGYRMDSVPPDYRTVNTKEDLEWARELWATRALPGE